MHLLTGTPIQNNTSELWSLLNLIDKKRFHSLPPFLETYGNPPTTNEQLEELQEALRPYLLGRKKVDVEASIAPIEEIVIWVELTTFQKQCYKAILEERRDLLAPGLKGADAPALTNLQMELRKCCNHPFLMPGVERSRYAGEVERYYHCGRKDGPIRQDGALIELLQKLRSRA